MFRPFHIFARFASANSKRLALLAAAIALTLLVSGSSGDASSGRTVRTSGDEQFVPNAKIMATLRFTPGHVTVKSGEDLTLVHDDKTEEPHTLSIVNANEVPGDIEAVFGCGEPGTVCDDVFQLFVSEPTSSTFVEGPATGAGIDGRLDTLFVVPGEDVTEPVTAPSGSTLYFICAIHAWMQGAIDVK